MPTILTQMRATGGAAAYAILGDSKVIEMEDDVFLYEPDKAPLALLTGKVSKKAVFNSDFNWLEDERIPTLDRVNKAAGYTAGDTGIQVDNPGYFHVPGLVRVQRTGEVFRVTSISGSTLTVKRSFGATAAAALVDNDQLTILGSNKEEGSTSPASKTTKKVKKYNATEIIRSAWELTNTEIATELYGPQDVVYQQMKVGIEHAVDIENKIWFGQYVSDLGGTLSASTSVRATGGLDEVISTNDSDFGGVFNMVTFFSFAEDVFRYGSKSKVLFAAPSVVSNISLEGIKYLQLVPKDQTFGMDINRLVTPHGNLMVIKHNLFEGDNHGKRAYVVDLDNVGYRFLRGRDTKLMTNIQANDKDSRKDEFLTEMGLVRRLEKTHGRITNAA